MAFKMKGFSGFTPPQEKKKNKMINKGGPVNPDRSGMTYVHEYNDDGDLKPGYPKWVKLKKVDPDAPGTPGKPGYEPPVKRSDLDAKGKKLWDSKRNK